MSSEEEYIVSARIDDLIDQDNSFNNMDPFARSWEEIKTYKGMSSNFKRNTNRKIEKFYPIPLRSYTIPKDSEGNISPQYAMAARALDYGEDGTPSKQLNPGEIYRNGYGLFDAITPPYNLYQLASFADTNFANHAAIVAKVQNVVGLGYHFEMTPNTQMRVESVDDEAKIAKVKKKIENLKIDTSEWLESLNDDESFTMTMKKVYADLEATGNGYIEIGRNVKGEIGYVGHIPAITMRVRRHRDGFVQIISGYVVYFRNFGAKNPNPITADTRPNEIIHLKKYSPLNSFYGIPDIVPAMQAITGDEMAAQYNIDYFQNKAVPRYIVTVKGAKLSADAEDRLFRFLQTGIKGQNHRTLYLPLPADTIDNKIEFNMQAIENTPQEASFEKYRQRNRDDIFIAHEVPSSKIGGSEGGSLAGALGSDRTFKEQYARPAQRELEKVIGKIIRERTDIIEIKFNELSLTDEVAQSQIYERYVKTQVMVPNEVRERLNLPHLPHGDEPFELKPQQQAEARTQMAGTRARDTERTNNQSDGEATISGRNPKGEGNSTEQ